MIFHHLYPVREDIRGQSVISEISIFSIHSFGGSLVRVAIYKPYSYN